MIRDHLDQFLSLPAKEFGLLQRPSLFAELRFLQESWRTFLKGLLAGFLPRFYFLGNRGPGTSKVAPEVTGPGVTARGEVLQAGRGGASDSGALPLTPACRLSFQNLVMFMSDFVDWVIPDIPKDISQQIHKEKALMVELFMREEQGRQQLLDTWMEKGRRKDEPCNNHSPKASLDSPEYHGGVL